MKLLIDFLYTISLVVAMAFSLEGALVLAVLISYAAALYTGMSFVIGTSSGSSSFRATLFLAGR